MKIAIFENEFQTISTPFHVVNLQLDQQLSLTQYNNSQDGIEDVINNEYDLIIIDIHLTERSVLDGYQIIEEIRNKKPNQPILILSGFGSSETITQELIKRKLPIYTIITKPIHFGELYNTLKSFL